MKQWSSEEGSQPIQAMGDAERSTHLFDSERQASNVQPDAPIGVFDSGVGGLTILAALRRELPHERYIYIGDTAHVPYGVRSDEEIIELSINACRFLIEQGVKLIVVACNTASQAALSVLRATFAVPFVGVVPAVKPAARLTRNGRIGVAATSNATRAAYLRQLIDDFASGIEVYAVGCPELVTLVEHGELDGPVVDETLQQALQPLFRQNVDVLVLGCTHFPALRPAIERLVGKRVKVIDSGAAIARRTHAILNAECIAHPASKNGDAGPSSEPILYCSGDPQAFSISASKVLGYAVAAQQVMV